MSTTARGPGRARHRRLARYRLRDRRSRWPLRARMWSRSRARSAASKNSTTRSGRPAARPRLVPLDLRDYRRHRPARRRALRALRAASTFSSAMPAIARRAFARSTISSRRRGTRHWRSMSPPTGTSSARCDPLLRRSDAGRAVFVTSGRGTRRAPIGRPIRCRRRRSTCWCGPMRRRRARPPCASICSIPARRARACARWPCRAKTR